MPLQSLAGEIQAACLQGAHQEVMVPDKQAKPATSPLHHVSSRELLHGVGDETSAGKRAGLQLAQNQRLGARGLQRLGVSWSPTSKAVGGLLSGWGSESSGFRLADFHPGSTVSSLSGVEKLLCPCGPQFPYL